MISIRIYILAALVISGLGGFFFYRYGAARYDQGYLQCQSDGAVLATEAGEQLKDVMRKAYSPSDVDRLLQLNDWMRPDNDR
jgi:hypothetical protein